tara:strand:+ start:1005 stop:1409 length:405 start_codon:yes stop_codon:yes gene_type:complete
MPDKTSIRIWTREEIDHLLIENDIAVMRAIVRLFQMQTADEISSGQTKHENSVGFSSADAKAGTRMARWLLGMDDRNEVRYPPKDLRHPLCQRVLGRYSQGKTVMHRARKIALKHSRQLVEIANRDSIKRSMIQ